MKAEFYGQPWAIVPEAFTRLIEELSRAESIEKAPLSALPAPSVSIPETGGGTAVIPIEGHILQRASDAKFLRRYQIPATATEEIADMVATAEKSNAKSIAFVVDSPGGTVTGVPETAKLIAEIKKPTASFTDGLMASAAYWLAGQADAVYATPSATVGSIGVFVPFEDVTGFLDRFGVKVELFKSGKYKGMGYPGVPLTQDQKTLIQDRVNGIHAKFKAAVTSRRSRVKDSAMEGQTFDGEQAAQEGLVTGIAASLPEMLTRFR